MISSFINYLSKHRYLLPVGIALLTLLTLLLTLLPGSSLPSSRFWSYDKLGHFLLFGSWTYLLGLYRYFTTGSQGNLFIIFLLGSGFGLAVELLQYLLPVQRQADFYDLAFDALGCLVAVFALKKTLPREWDASA